jgi:hypothetical protein
VFAPSIIPAEKDISELMEAFRKVKLEEWGEDLKMMSSVQEEFEKQFGGATPA